MASRIVFLNGQETIVTETEDQVVRHEIAPWLATTPAEHLDIDEFLGGHRRRGGAHLAPQGA
jgi:hypothetical protein